MPDLGKLWVQVVPSAQGFNAELTDILVPAADSAGSEAGGSFMASMAKGLAAGALAFTGALVGVTTAAVKGASEFAQYGDNIDKMSQKMGMSATAYQEWDAVMQHSGTSMEAMKSSMKTLANAAETGSDAFEKLGITQEELKSLNQEQLFARTIEALQNVDDETTRTYLAGKTLGKGATELGALLNTSAEDTQAMKDRVHELGGVLSDDAVKAAAEFQDNLQDMTTAMDGMKRNIAASFLPGLNDIMAGITGLMAGDEGATAQLKDGIYNLMTTIAESIPEIASTAYSLMQAFIGAIVEIVPELAQKGYEAVSGFASGILENLPSLISTGFEMVSSLAAYILQNLPTLAQKGVEIVGSMANGITQNLPAIVGAIAGGMAKLLATIGQNLPSFLQKGLELIGKIAAGIVQAIPTLLSKIPGILTDVRSKFTSYNWADIGSKIIDGIVKGIKNGATKIVNAAKNMAKDAFNAAKDFLGIHSPSRLFQYLGDMTVEGYRMEIEAGAEPIQKTMTSALTDTVGSTAANISGAFSTAQDALAYDFGSATPIDTVIEVPLYIDGREVAKATAAYDQQEQGRLQRNMNRRLGIA